MGPTHEYYDLPKGSRNDKLDSIWIDDIGDGGSKGDKFERDIRLLKQGIEEEPNNGRYYFYLANSYFNTGKHEESIQYYKKRKAATFGSTPFLLHYGYCFKLHLCRAYYLSYGG